MQNRNCIRKEKEIGIEKGDKFFTDKYYGIKSTDAMNYELNLLSLIDEDLEKKQTNNILGIDTLCGTPILELKNKFREKGLFETKLYFTEPSI